jgi:hypothetical protein
MGGHDLHILGADEGEGEEDADAAEGEDADEPMEPAP